MQSLEIRAQKGKEIADVFGTINRLDEHTYKVKSQRLDMYYEVLQTERGWTCQCADQRFRGVKCKHIWAVEFSFAIRRLVKKEVVIEPVNISNCPKCKSDKIKKAGIRKNKYGNIQKFQCKDCSYWFTVNLGFEGMKHNPQAISSAMQLYFSGESLRHTQDFLALQGVKISYVGIYKWIRKYVSLMQNYLDKLQPQVGNAWRTDEVYVKIRGNPKYLFAMMDDETRFWISQQVADRKGTDDVKPMFREAQRIAGKNPTAIISDGANNFAEATVNVFYNRNLPRNEQVKHIRDITFDGERHNNKQERFNGEFRDREKVVRGVKKADSPIFQGAQIYHNYIRPHMALEGKTPADLAGIKVQGENKWLTLIQNASQLQSVSRSIRP